MIIGVDLGGTKVRAGISSGGKIRDQRQELFNSQGTKKETLQQLKEMIRPLVTSGVRAIGVGVPSVIDVEQGIVYNVVNIPSWDKVPLKDILEQEFGMPVAVNNDVNCFALGEHRFGRLKGFRHAVGITSGTGLGAGVIINGELYCGSNCGAGELGLLNYGDHTVEYYASGNFFDAVHGLPAVQANDLAAAGDANALAMWQQFGIHMGNAVKTVIYSFDPEAIVIGGSLSKAFRFFEQAMLRSLENFTFPESVRRLKIMQSENEDIILLGAAALPEAGSKVRLRDAGQPRATRKTPS